jgi:hypothetical protein
VEERCGDVLAAFFCAWAVWGIPPSKAAQKRAKAMTRRDNDADIKMGLTSSETRRVGKTAVTHCGGAAHAGDAEEEAAVFRLTGKHLRAKRRANGTPQGAAEAECHHCRLSLRTAALS